MTLKRDHIAGGALVAAGLFVYAVSGDLPWGSMAMPGAGMMPKLVIVLMVAFAATLLLRASDSPALATLAWSDLPHAARVVVVTAAAVALYSPLGFIVTIALLLFSLTWIVERKPILHALLFSVGVTGIAYLLFNTLLKSPLPRGVFWL